MNHLMSMFSGSYQSDDVYVLESYHKTDQGPWEKEGSDLSVLQGCKVCKDPSADRWGLISWFDQFNGSSMTFPLDQKPRYYWGDVIVESARSNRKLVLRYLNLSVYREIQSRLLEAPSLRSNKEVQQYFKTMNSYST